MQTIDQPIFHALQEIIADHLVIKRSEVSLTDSFKDFGMDSLDHTQLICTCENHWDIEIPESEAIACKTVANLHDAIFRARIDQYLSTTSSH